MTDDVNEEIEDDCYDVCHKVEFKDIVGAKTLSDSGQLGALLSVARLHIDDAKKNGELTDSAAGEVYAKAIESAMAQSVQFGLQSAKMQIDIELVDAQIAYQKHKTILEKDQFALEEYIQRAKLSLEKEKTYSDIQVNRANITSMETKDKQVFQAIKQSEKEIDKMSAEITRMKCDCDNQTALANSKMDVEKAQIVKMKCECDNEKATTNSKLDVEKATIIKMQADTDIGQKTTDSKIAVDKSQIVKMSVDNSVSVAGTNSKIYLERAQTQKISIDAGNETKLNTSKIMLNNHQVAKMKCDCANQAKISTAQARLYEQQMTGFRDNARQKLFEAQMQGYAMVFEAAEFGETSSPVPDFFTKSQLDTTYNALVQRTFT